MLEALMGWAGFGCLAFMAFLVPFAVYVVAEAHYYQGRLAQELRRDLGFEHGTAYRRDGRRTADVLIIASLVPGGIFDRAGFRVGDIIRGPSIGGLYKMLHRGRGRRVQITVIDGGEGPRLEQRPKRVITVQVPIRSPS
jgi:hypothetical protein